MPSAVQYAQFATNAYAASSLVVAQNNQIPIPDGWKLLQNGSNPATGFLARAYKNDATGEIVIAYAGTTFEDGMKSLDWTKGNIPGASGLTLGEQIVDAARFYLDVYNANPNAGISFTGHSLGGGLAALMAVYFERAAQTFDPAPFARSADSSAVVNELKSRLGELGYVQAGNAGMNATDTLNNGAFMLGGNSDGDSNDMIHAANDANYDNSFERSAA